MESFPVDGKRALAVTSERAGAYMHGGGEGQTEVQLAGGGRTWTWGEPAEGRSRSRRRKETPANEAVMRRSCKRRMSEWMDELGRCVRD